MTQFLLGADPELFMRNANSGSFVSAHGLVPGTKQAPHKVEYGAVQIDGTALEFNIDPAASVDEFWRNITEVRKTIAGYVPGYNVVAEPTALYDKEYFDWEVPSTAKELGCDPDFNAYTLATNPRPEPGDRPMRTAAGHIHIGWTKDADVFDKDHFEQCARVARQMDYYLGIYSLRWDGDSTRRELYGKAGAFRPKPYGCEYRVLSNRWLSSDALIRWVYKQTIAAMEAGEAGRWAEKVWDKTAQNIINSNMTDWRDHYPIELGVIGPPGGGRRVKIEYDNLKDAQSKLLGTYCMYDGEAIVVKNVYNDNGADDKFVLDGYKMSTQRGVGLISLNDKKFNCADFNIGYMNKLSHAGWWYRLPVKQYYQGLRHSQCAVKTSSPTEYPLEMKASKALANMLENTYPKLDIAVEMLKSGEANIAAFHRNFAVTFDRIHSDFILEYKGDLIGHFKKLGEFALMPQFEHLKEALQEAVG